MIRHEGRLSRRALLSRCGALTAGLSVAGLTGRALAQAVEQKPSAEKKPDVEGEVSAVEDFMREHGLLARLLLLYEHQLGNSSTGWEFNREAVAATANLLRRFVEDYHEKLEEQHVFPRFAEQGGQMADLVKTLRQQHDAGRRVTDAILELASADAPLDDTNRARIDELIRQYVRMYWPHLAREDTVLFPAFKEIVPKNEYKKLGDRFEAQEEELFGENGFQNVVEQVAELERKAGIYDLDQLTPRV